MDGFDRLPGIDGEESTRRNVLVGGGYALGGLLTAGAVLDRTLPEDDSADGSVGAVTSTSTSTATPTGDTTTADGDEPSGNPAASAVVGELVDGERTSMVVASITRLDATDDRSADEGNVFAAVRLVVKNTARERPTSMATFLEATVADGDGNAYEPVTGATDGVFLNGQLVPGELARGDVVFEVPRDAVELTLRFDFRSFGAFGFERLTVDLTERAEHVASLEQSLRVSVLGLGGGDKQRGVEVSVEGVTFTDEIDDVRAPAGQEFALVDVTTANETNGVFDFSAPLQTATKDDLGRAFDHAPAATERLPDGYDGQEVGPGGWLVGTLAFRVPAGVSPVYFVFRFDIVGGGQKTFWRLR